MKKLTDNRKSKKISASFIYMTKSSQILTIHKNVSKMQCFGSGFVLDPDPGGQKWFTKIEKSEESEVLDVLLWGLKAFPVAWTSLYHMEACKLQFWSKKITIFSIFNGVGFFIYIFLYKITYDSYCNTCKGQILACCTLDVLERVLNLTINENNCTIRINEIKRHSR